MKLASYKDGSRDGQLLVVSRDLSLAHYATGIATRLQQLLDDWNFLSPQLEELSQTLNHGKARHAFAFDPGLCMAPLPRAGQWVEACVEARPLLQQGRSDAFFGPCEAIELPAVGPGSTEGAEAELDFHGQLAVVTGDLARGSSPAVALDAVRLLMLANSLHAEPAYAGLGGAIGVAFAPVAVTPDELGSAWQNGRVLLDLELQRNGKPFGLCDLGADLPWDFGELLARTTQRRGLRAGCLLGGGAVTPIDGTRGDASIGARRRREAGEAGTKPSPWLQPGDSLRIEVKGRDGLSLFGAIEQTVLQGR